jgi:hypothetical protein
MPHLVKFFLQAGEDCATNEYMPDTRTAMFLPCDLAERKAMTRLRRHLGLRSHMDVIRHLAWGNDTVPRKIARKFAKPRGAK